LPEQRRAKDGQMADVVAALEIFRRVVGLEVPGARLFDVGLKQGFVAVQEGSAGLLCGAGHPVDRMGGQHVVVVGQCHVFAVGQLGGGVGVGRDAPVFDLHIPDAAVGGSGG